MANGLDGEALWKQMAKANNGFVEDGMQTAKRAALASGQNPGMLIVAPPEYRGLDVENAEFGQVFVVQNPKIGPLELASVEYALGHFSNLKKIVVIGWTEEQAKEQIAQLRESEAIRGAIESKKVEIVGHAVLKENVKGGHKAVLVTCSDSRIVPGGILGSTQIRDANVLRVAGNVVEGTVLEAVVERLHNVSLLVVMGHTSCGAVGSAEEAAKGHGAGHASRAMAHLLAQLKPEVEANVRHQVEMVQEDASVKQAIERGLVIVGCVYDLNTGQVRVLETVKKNGTAKMRA